MFPWGSVVARTEDWKVQANLKETIPSLNHGWQMLLPLYWECDGSIKLWLLDFHNIKLWPRYISCTWLSSDGTYAVGVVCSICFCWPNTKILEFWLEAATMMYNWMFWTIPSPFSIALVNVHLDNVKSTVAQADIFQELYMRYKKSTLVAVCVLNFESSF